MIHRVINNVAWHHSVFRYSGSRYVRYDSGTRLGYAEFHYAEWHQYCKSVYYIT